MTAKKPSMVYEHNTKLCKNPIFYKIITFSASTYMCNLHQEQENNNMISNLITMQYNSWYFNKFTMNAHVNVIIISMYIKPSHFGQWPLNKLFSSKTSKLTLKLFYTELILNAQTFKKLYGCYVTNAKHNWYLTETWLNTTITDRKNTTES